MVNRGLISRPRLGEEAMSAEARVLLGVAGLKAQAVGRRVRTAQNSCGRARLLGPGSLVICARLAGPGARRAARRQNRRGTRSTARPSLDRARRRGRARRDNNRKYTGSQEPVGTPKVLRHSIRSGHFHTRARCIAVGGFHFKGSAGGGPHAAGWLFNPLSFVKLLGPRGAGAWREIEKGEDRQFR